MTAPVEVGLIVGKLMVIKSILSSSAFVKVFAGLGFVLSLTLAPMSAMAHGGLSLDKDVCKLTIGTYSMHFTGYQPEGSGGTEFCEDIPNVGATVVVLDAIDEVLRDIPIEVKIITDSGQADDSGAVQLLSLPPKLYPTGTVSFEYKFDKPGKYVGIVTAGEKGEFVSRFPFSVGVAKSSVGMYMLIVAVLLVGAGLIAYSKSARRRFEAKAMAAKDAPQKSE